MVGLGLYWYIMNVLWNLKIMLLLSFLGLKGWEIYILVYGNIVRRLGLNWSEIVFGNMLRVYYGINVFMKIFFNFGIGVGIKLN